MLLCCDREVPCDIVLLLCSVIVIGREVPCDWQLCLDAAARCDYSISPFYPPMIIISQLLIINLSIVSAWLRKLAKNRVIVNASRSLAKFSSDENIKRWAQRVSPNWFLWHLVWEGIGSHNGSNKGVQITPQLWRFGMRELSLFKSDYMVKGKEWSILSIINAIKSIE